MVGRARVWRLDPSYGCARPSRRPDPARPGLGAYRPKPKRSFRLVYDHCGHVHQRPVSRSPYLAPVAVLSSATSRRLRSRRSTRGESSARDATGHRGHHDRHSTIAGPAPRDQRGSARRACTGEPWVTYSSTPSCLSISKQSLPKDVISQRSSPGFQPPYCPIDTSTTNPDADRVGRSASSAAAYRGRISVNSDDFHPLWFSVPGSKDLSPAITASSLTWGDSIGTRARTRREATSTTAGSSCSRPSLRIFPNRRIFEWSAVTIAPSTHWARSWSLASSVPSRRRDTASAVKSSNAMAHTSSA